MTKNEAKKNGDEVKAEDRVRGSGVFAVITGLPMIVLGYLQWLGMYDVKSIEASDVFVWWLFIAGSITSLWGVQRIFLKKVYVAKEAITFMLGFWAVAFTLLSLARSASL